MGILVSNRKRGDEVSGQFDREEDWISKRRRFSLSTFPTISRDSSTITASRISQYPDIKSGFRKRLHAPVRNLRFTPSSDKSKLTGVYSVASQSYCSSLSMRYEQTKKEAVGSLRFLGKYVDNTMECQESVPDECGFGNMKLEENNRIEEKLAADNTQEDLDAVVINKMGSSESSVVIDEVHSNGREDVSNNMESKQLDRVSDSTVPIHKKMLERIRIQSGNNMIRLNLMIDIAFDKLQMIRLLRPSKKEEETKKNLVAEYFKSLTEEEEIAVSDAMSNRNRRKVIVVHESSNIDITGEKLQCLGSGAWLNDEVINLYLELLKERENREPEKFLKCHFFNTFFYKKLISGRDGYNYQSVRRWTTQKKLKYSLLDCKKIFVPIHKEIHWCLAIINKEEEKFQYLDSLKGHDSKVLKVLARYFVDEVKDKCGQVTDVSSWKYEFVDDLPEQKNGFDCGVFMIKYADFHSRGIGLCFRQEHMPYFRRRTAKEIMNLRAE